jgi:predicted nucleic acid-binding protein
VILVDTSVWVDFLNSARGPAGDELERLIRANAPLVLTGLVLTEVLQGLKRDVGPVTELLPRWPLIEPGGFATYEAAATIFRQARTRGLTLSTVDAVLAALALEYNAAFFTLDQDFERLAFTGLRLHWGNRRRKDRV